MFLEYNNLNPLTGQDIHGLLLANIYFKITAVFTIGDCAGI
jgi:hypothetical protein